MIIIELCYGSGIRFPQRLPPNRSEIVLRSEHVSTPRLQSVCRVRPRNPRPTGHPAWPETVRLGSPTRLRHDRHQGLRYFPLSGSDGFLPPANPRRPSRTSPLKGAVITGISCRASLSSMHSPYSFLLPASGRTSVADSVRFSDVNRRLTTRLLMLHLLRP